VAHVREELALGAAGVRSHPRGFFPRAGSILHLGLEAGIDGSVAVANVGAGGSLDTKTVQQPIIGFIFSNKGLMANLNFEGTKITQIER
jgi:hypothetical protein